MTQPKNMSNKSVISILERALKEETNPNKKPNISACLKKARETTETIKWDQVIWAVNGTDAFISSRMEEILKVHKHHKAELGKVYALCLAGSYAMMAGPGSNSSSSTPQPPPTGTALGCAQSRGANPVSSPAPAPGAAGRTQPPATAGRAQSPATAGRTQSPATAGRAQSPATAGRTQSPATASRAQSPATASRTQPPATAGRAQSPATASRAAQQIPNPTEDEKKAVALYTDRWQSHPYGMHTIWAKIRMHPNYQVGQTEVNIDINYDTGSTAQGVPAAVLEKMIGKNPAVSWFEEDSTIADGSTRKAHTGMFQLRLFTDPARTKPMEDWFDAYGRVNATFALSGGEMRFATGLTFANLPGLNSPLIVGKSKPAVIYHILNSR